jgi:sortase A
VSALEELDVGVSTTPGGFDSDGDRLQSLWEEREETNGGPPPKGQLDLRREAILTAIANGHGRSQRKLAAHVGELLGLPASAMVKEIKRLERDGVVTAKRGKGGSKAFTVTESEAEPAWKQAPAGVSRKARARTKRVRARVGARRKATRYSLLRTRTEIKTALGTTLERVRAAVLLRRPEPSEETVSRLARALPIALLVVGGLVLVEGAVTVLWKEPFTAISAARSQATLEDELEEKAALAAAEAAEAAETQRKLKRYVAGQAALTSQKAQAGDALGNVSIPAIDADFVVVQGTDEESLKKGPGHYLETPLPGAKAKEPYTVGIAGHRTTYLAPFRDLDALEKGDEVVIEMPYGRFTYGITETRIVDDQYTGAFEPQGRYMLVLTACHPLYSAAQRILAYSRLKYFEPLASKA